MVGTGVQSRGRSTSDGFLGATAGTGGPAHSSTRAEPLHSHGTGTAAALLLEGTYSMMYDLDLTVVVTATGIVVLAAVYVWSKDANRRARAWRVLKLLLGR
jgi:hypothetical protein